MLLVAYGFTILNYIFYCSSRFCKEKKNMLLFDILAKISTIISLLLLSSITGAIVMCVSLIMLLVARYKEQKGMNKYLTIILYLLFIGIYVTNLILTYKGLSSILVTTTALLTLTSVWFLKPQNMRKMGILVSTIYLFYQISIKNWAGLLEAFVIVSNIASLIKYKEPVANK